MNIQITETGPADKAIVDGFCSATGWTDKLGVAQADWLKKKTAEFILQKARQGFVAATTESRRQVYMADVIAAHKTSNDTIPTASITLAKSS